MCLVGRRKKNRRAYPQDNPRQDRAAYAGKDLLESALTKAGLLQQSHRIHGINA
jgi:hypothetical protein